jgi:hypothetical protein
MLDNQNLGERDLSTIDIRTIGPEEWQAVKREVARRAHAERAQTMRILIGWLPIFWQRSTRHLGVHDEACPSAQERFSLVRRM